MLENAVSEKETKSVSPYKKAAFDAYITFCALGGMLVSDTGGLSAMTLGQFCSTVGVDEETTRRWKKQTPDFAMRVRARRDEIVPLARETAAWNRLFMIGVSSLPTGKDKDGKLVGALHHDQRAAVDALTKVLGHFGELQLPVQRQDIKVQGGLMEVLAAAQRDGIIEGEVIDEPNPEPGASPEAPSPLPLSP